MIQTFQSLQSMKTNLRYFCPLSGIVNIYLCTHPCFSVLLNFNCHPTSTTSLLIQKPISRHMRHMSYATCWAYTREHENWSVSSNCVQLSCQHKQEKDEMPCCRQAVGAVGFQREATSADRGVKEVAKLDGGHVWCLWNDDCELARTQGAGAGKGEHIRQR